jgi:hypothetical protein
MVPLLTKKKSFNRSFPNGIGSLIVADVGLVRIRRKVVTIKMPNILDDNVDELKVTVSHYNAFISPINIALVLFFTSKLISSLLFSFVNITIR